MKYGFPKLGELAKFIRGCIGDDALLEQKSKEIPNYDRDKDKERIKKEWNRFCQEKNDDYYGYRWEENKIMILAEKFFEEIHKKYNFPTDLGECILQLYQNCYDEMAAEDIISIVAIENKKNDLIDKLNTYIEKDYSYKTLFEKLLQQKNSSLTKYIENLGIKFEQANYQTKESKLNDNGTTKNKIKQENKCATFRDTIDNAIKKEKNPTWERFLFILQDFPDESIQLKTDFLFHYFSNNIKQALKECFDSNFENIEKIDEYYQKTCIQYEYKKTNKENFFSYLNEIKNIAQYASSFFIPWFKGFVYVAYGEDGHARTCFKQAFDHYQFASQYLLRFIEMVFSFENFYSDWKNTRKSIKKEDDIQTPVTKHAKMYWNFGYAIGAFDKKADDTYFETYKKLENFYQYFPVECFSGIKKDVVEILANIMSEFGFSFEKYDKERMYKFLSDLKTDYQRNKLISKIPWSDNSKEQLYTPLALCIKHGNQDERLWDLANEWLNDTINPIDVDKTCFNGSTALNEALTIYKGMRLKSSTVTEKQKKIKDLIFKLIDKATYFGETKQNSKIHPLQQAIDSYDINIIKCISDKIDKVANKTGISFQNLRISDDELSPIYYTLGRRNPLIMGLENFIEKTKENPGNINWKNSNYPGYTEEEKRRFMYNLKHGNDPFAKFSQAFDEKFSPIFWSLFYGFDTKDAQLLAFEEILNELIKRTDNVDEFVSILQDFKNQGLTALMYAAEINDTYACRKLIQAGADVTKIIGENTLFIDSNGNETNSPNSFIFRLIYWQSWDALKMFLTEFRDKAKLVMGKGKYDISPMEYFIIWTKILMQQAPTNNESMKLMQIQKEITPLFMQAGATL